MTRKRVCCGAFALAAACAAGASWSQTLYIPDFRKSQAPSKLRPGDKCADCGRIVSIREIYVDRGSSVPTSFQGASRGPGEHNLVGAVVYLPFGSSGGDKPFVGGVGTPEMRERFGSQSYDIMVRMEDGAMRSVRRADGGRYGVGERVRLEQSGAFEVVEE
jgi:hypothetical protein